jgi:hypothetical protein
MDDIGNATRVHLMHRLIQLKLEHRDLDGVIHRIADDPTHDQLQLTRLKRRKLLLKDHARIEREIDPTSWRDLQAAGARTCLQRRCRPHRGNRRTAPISTSMPLPDWRDGAWSPME